MLINLVVLSMPSAKSSLVFRILSRIESAGNHLPAPTLLFVYLALGILLLSALTSWLGVSALHPVTQQPIQALNLLSAEGLHRILESTVTNFTQFAPVGTVLVAMLGIGVAERSGLFAVVLGTAVRRAKGVWLTAIVVFVAIMSSLAADTGYVVLIPLAALMFHAAGRHPLAGIAAAFAGVSGGYSANLLLGPFDAILAGISTEAAQIIEPNYHVSIAANYYFMIASTFLITVVGTFVTNRWVEPRLMAETADQPMLTADIAQSSDANSSSVNDRRGLIAVGILSLLFVTLILWGLIPSDGILRSPQGEVLRSPFIKGIVVIISVYALLCGAVFARVSGRWKNLSECVGAMESSMATMASYLVLMFFAAQFVAYFSWSQLGIISAIEGANQLRSWQLSHEFLLLVFVLIAASINLLIGSGSAKWALLAPIFVPMLLLAGIPPESSQIAFRIGDSVTNIITPLMPYFGVVIAYAQRYKPNLGIGTLMALMLPYSVSFLIAWSALMMVWLSMGWPLGLS
jgi:aminobenzoyl-glutamate transport protein